MKEQVRNIYNRFFRTATLGRLKYYFGEYEKIVIKRIFHDRNELENDEIFNWHTIQSIKKKEEQIEFDEKHIYFIESDHRKEKNFPKESHFIQLIDLVLGATKQYLDAPNDRPGCNEIGQMFLPLIERLNDENKSNNPRSRLIIL